MSATAVLCALAQVTPSYGLIYVSQIDQRRVSDVNMADRRGSMNCEWPRQRLATSGNRILTET